MSAAFDAWIDHERVGTGRRAVVVLTLGPKWARLFVPGIMAAITTTRENWDRADPRPLDPLRLARRIRRDRKTWARLYPADADGPERWRSSSAAALEALDADQGINI